MERLEAQEPAVLRKLRTLAPGQLPLCGWVEFLGAATGSPSAAAGA